MKASARRKAQPVSPPIPRTPPQSAAPPS
jgi:hypothetical protein